jgi:hypothetical protein
MGDLAHCSGRYNRQSNNLLRCHFIASEDGFGLVQDVALDGSNSLINCYLLAWLNLH